MYHQTSKYELAIKFEQDGYFMVAYPMFKECLEDKISEPGNVLFKCGWCIEHISEFDNNLAVTYYLKAGQSTKDTICKMNSYFRAGWVLMHLNQNETAIDAYRNAIETGHSEGIFNSIYQDALYWCAVCLESDNRFLDAIYLYRAVRAISLTLGPESRYREIKCLVAVGLYSKALQVCDSFNAAPPSGFPQKRYDELKKSAEKEKRFLSECYPSKLNNNRRISD